MKPLYAFVGQQECWPYHYTWIEGDNVPAVFTSESDARKEIQDYLEEWALSRSDEIIEDGDAPENYQIYRVEVSEREMKCFDAFSGEHCFDFDWTAQL